MINLASSERPMRYSDAIGQETNAKILKNMSLKDAYAKAYLFEGMHGCGKTSLARVTAMAANCMHKLPDGEPCGQCETCRKIMAGEEIDVVEIDAASNNSVERARELIEESRFQPLECKTKVYIIDEAHMLSNGAFNALLKLLEEPPAWCMYILCTTAKAKIPGTILSRCTAFNFKAISFEKIAAHLKELVAKYSCTITDDAAYAIASHSGGSMRDAVRDLEKCLSESMDISCEDVADALGFEPYEQIFRLLTAVCDNNAAEIIATCERYRLEAKDMLLVLTDLVAVLTDLVMVTAGGKLAERGEGYTALLNELAEETTLEKALYLSKKFAEIRRNSLYDADAMAITVELLRAASANEQSVEALEVKVHDLEERLSKLEAAVANGCVKTIPVKATVSAASEAISKAAGAAKAAGEIRKPEPVKVEKSEVKERPVITDGFTPVFREECPFDEDDEAYWQQVLAVADAMAEETTSEVTEEVNVTTELSGATEEDARVDVPETTGAVTSAEFKVEEPEEVAEEVNVTGEPETVSECASSVSLFGGTGFGGVFDMFAGFGASENTSKGLVKTFKERIEDVKAKDAEAADVLNKAEEVNIYKDCVEVIPLGYMEAVTRKVLSRYEFIKVIASE